MELNQQNRQGPAKSECGKLRQNVIAASRCWLSPVFLTAPRGYDRNLQEESGFRVYLAFKLSSLTSALRQPQTAASSLWFNSFNKAMREQKAVKIRGGIQDTLCLESESKFYLCFQYDV